MRLLQQFILDSIAEHLPGIDKEQLRVDVLNGRCTLENVDCTPGPVLSFDGFPFHLAAGRIGNLELKVPWKSLSSSPVRVCAENVSLRLEEIPFASRMAEVRDAFSTAKRRAKLRSIADGERRASMVSRLLQKLLPLFLAHVEVDLTDVEICITLADGFHAALHFDKIATSDTSGSRAGQQQSAGDLSKQLQIGNVRVDVFKRCDAMTDFDKVDDLCRLEFMDGLWKKATVFCIPKFEVSLNFDGGAVALMFEIPCAVVLTLHTILIDLLLAFKKSRLRWSAAHVRWCIMHNRTSLLSQPLLRPAQDPKSWFRYAAQEAVNLKRGAGLKALSDEYKSLHLRRLTANHLLQPAENDRISVLEEILEIRTILTLRDQASREVLVDEATTLATGDLLSRWLFGSKLTDERETIASEIRQALDSLERFSKDFGSPVDKLGNASEARPVGGTWTKAVVTVRLQRFEIGVVHADSKLLLSVCDVKGWAEMDSSLSNFAVVLTFEDIMLSNGSFFLVRRAYPNHIEPGVLMQWEPSSCVAPPLNRDSVGAIQVSKMRLDPSVIVSVSFASFCIELDAPSLAPLVGYANHARRSVASKKSISASAGSGSPSSSVVSVVIEAKFAESTLLVAIPRSVNDPYLSKKVFCLDLQETVINVAVETEVRTATICTKLGLRAGVFQDSSRLVHAEELKLRIVEEFSVDVSFERKSFKVDIGDVNVLLKNENVEACTSLTAFLVEELAVKNVSRQEVAGTTDIRLASSIRCLAGFPRILLESSAIHLHLEANDSSEMTLVSLKCVSGVLGEGIIRVSARDVLLGTSDDKASLQIHPATANEHGISVEYYLRDQDPDDANSNAKSTRSPRLQLRAGNGSICSSPVDLSRILNSVLAYVKQFWYAIQVPLIAKQEAFVSRDDELATQPQLNVSVLLQSLSVEIPSDDMRLRLRSDICVYEFKEGNHSGSFQKVELLDLSNKAGHYCRPVETLGSESADAPVGKCISFHVQGQVCEVRLSHLHVVLLRPFVEKVVGIVSSVVEVVLAFAEEVDVVFSHAHTLCNRLPSAASENDTEELSDDINQNVVIRGHDLKLTVPVHKSSFGALNISLPEAVVTLGDGVQVVNLRKAAVLTRPSTSSPQASLASSSENPLFREWIYLIRSLDLDFSHREKQFETTELSHKTRSQWSFEVLNHATVFLVPSQVMLIRNVIVQLFPPPPETHVLSDSTVQTKSEHADSPQTPVEGKESDADTVPDARPIFDHLVVDVGTEVLSIELLEEGEHGSVAASIANLTCGPCWFSLESIHDTSSGKSTRVMKKTLSILSVWIEDRRRGVPSETGLILAIRPKINAPQVLLKRIDSESSSCSIYFESLSRVENDDEKVASKLRISEPLVCFCPDLVASLSTFFSDSISVDEVENDGSTASSATIIDDDEEKLSSEPQSPVNSSQVEAVKTVAQQVASQSLPVSFKVSVSILKPTLFVPIPWTRKEFGLKLTSGGIGGSLLMGKDGCVQCGSSVRSKSIEVSMPPLSWRFGNGDTLNADSVFGDEDRFQPVDRRLSAFTDENPAEYTNAFNVGHALYDWERSEFSPVLLSTISGVSAKLSSSLGSCWGISVGGIHANTDLKTLLNCSLLFKRTGGSPGSQTQSSNPVDLSVRNVSFHVRIPVVADNAELCERNFQVRLRGGIRCRLVRDMAFITSRARLSADVLNENTSVRDQLLAPCDIKVKMDTVASRVSVTVPMSVQVIVSPLTMRTVASICLLAARHMQRRRDVSSPTDSIPTEGVIQEDSSNQGTEIFVNIRGIVTSLVAEEPRAPLMRFVFRDVRSHVLWVTEELSWGHFELEVGAIVLEDVISWQIFADDHRTDELEWNTLFSSANDLDNTSASRPSDFPPRISGPSDPTRPLLQPGSFEHETLQMTLPFPTEDLAIDESLGPSNEKGSFFCIYSKWQYPSQHIAVQVTVGPLDLRLNSTILPSLLEWVKSIGTALEDVWSAHADDLRFSQQNSDQYYQSAPRIGIDNFVVEPITIRIATKAPPRPAEQSAFHRLLDWLVGSDFMSGLTLETTRISFVGNFTDLGSFFGRLRVEYFNALMSRYMIAQLFMQVPALSTLTRVGASTVLRQGNFSVSRSILGASPSSVRPQSALGLASVLNDSSNAIPTAVEGISGLKKTGVVTRLQRSVGGAYGLAELGRNDSDLSMEIVDISTIPPR